MSILFICPHKSHFSILRVFQDIIRKTPDANQISLPEYRASLVGLWNNLRFLRNNRKHYDIYHITGDVYYCAWLLPPGKTILTIHDFNLLEYYHFGFIKRMIYKFIWFDVPLRRARTITCITQKTKQELLKYYPWAKGKTTVIGNPYSTDYVFTPKPFAEQMPRILHIGTRKNKNLERVVRALDGIPCHLRIIGELSDEQKNLLEMRHLCYSAASNLSDSQIVQEYIDADIISFPSLYEGFGMPVIEGFATGRCVLTSQIEPMLSIASGAAFLVDPMDTESIKKGFLEIIGNAEERQRKIEKGLQVVRDYTPEMISKRYHELYALM